MQTRPDFDFEVVNISEVGRGNALFLVDLMQGRDNPNIVNILRENWKAGKYPNSSIDFIKANLKFWGKA